ncbi:MAG: hypothetical protein KJP06_03655 [Deltaproteobacteria bacterium]|nr:hypothetical protein [Deltaproteobacteria bacterium]
MRIYNLAGLLEQYGDQCLILEFNHLFVASSIREEVWLLQRKNDLALIDRILEKAAAFDLLEVDADRNFETYSGGQRAILGCLLALELIRVRGIEGLKLLLNNILDSISDDNRVRLMQLFENMRSSHHIRIFTQKENQLQEVFSENDDT